MSFYFSDSSDSQKDALNYFADLGEDYEKYRPIYPDEAIATILSGFNPANQLVAADIGSGTGIGARSLADKGVRVWAIEPNADMRSAATPHERVAFLEGTAEQIPLDDASVDLVTSFQAFHWFDFDRSLLEFRRILKPGGRLALAWSLWEQSDRVTKEYTRLIFSASDRGKSRPGQPANWFKSLRYQLFWQGWWLSSFHNLKRDLFTFQQELDLAGLIGLARSQGFTPSRGEALNKLASEIAQFHRKFRGEGGKVSLTYQTRLYLANSGYR